MLAVLQAATAVAAVVAAAAVEDLSWLEEILRTGRI